MYASTRAEELARTDWSDEQKAAFCRMQFVAQDIEYRQNYRSAAFDVVELGDVDIGRLYVDRREGSIHIIDISMLPAHRGAGIGTSLLHGLQEEARTEGKRVTIHVEKLNPALRLYERLGFRPLEDKGIYLLMAWQA